MRQSVFCRQCQRPTLHEADPSTVNHVLHLLISVFLCGLWLPVWLLLAIFSDEGGTVRCTVCGCAPPVKKESIDWRGVAWLGGGTVVFVVCVIGALVVWTISASRQFDAERAQRREAEAREAKEIRDGGTEAERKQREERRNAAIEFNRAAAKPDPNAIVEREEPKKPAPLNRSVIDEPFVKGAPTAEELEAEKKKADAEAEAELEAAREAKAEKDRKREASAASRFKLGQQIPDKEKRRKWLQAIVDELPGTAGATDAEQAIKELK